jgi:hypothetical protein
MPSPINQERPATRRAFEFDCIYRPQEPTTRGLLSPRKKRRSILTMSFLLP